MVAKDLNTLSKELILEHVLTDELLEFFREIDVMNSVGMMSWLTSTCKDAVKEIEAGNQISYNGRTLNREGFLGVLNENISDFLMRRILNL